MPANAASLPLTSAYHNKLANLAEQVARIAGARTPRLAKGEMDDAFKAFTAQAAGIVELGQRHAIELTTAFLGRLSELETGARPESEPESEIPGFTADGRPLSKAVAATPAKVYLALKQGRPFEVAMAFAKMSIGRLARTEVFDAADRRQAELGVTQWRWRSRGTCGACLAMDDGNTMTGDLERHPNCACIREPTFDAPDRFQRASGRDRFLAMSVKEQDRILGPEKAEAIREGLISWDALVHVEQFRKWTPAVVEVTAAALNLG